MEVAIGNHTCQQVCWRIWFLRVREGHSCEGYELGIFSSNVLTDRPISRKVSNFSHSTNVELTEALHISSRKEQQSLCVL